MLGWLSLGYIVAGKTIKAVQDDKYNTNSRQKALLERKRNPLSTGLYLTNDSKTRSIDSNGQYVATGHQFINGYNDFVVYDYHTHKVIRNISELERNAEYERLKKDIPYRTTVDDNFYRNEWYDGAERGEDIVTDLMTKRHYGVRALCSEPRINERDTKKGNPYGYYANKTFLYMDIESGELIRRTDGQILYDQGKIKIEYEYQRVENTIQPEKTDDFIKEFNENQKFNLAHNDLKDHSFARDYFYRWNRYEDPYRLGNRIVHGEAPDRLLIRAYDTHLFEYELQLKFAKKQFKSNV